MKSPIKENNGGSGFRITKPPLRTTLPGCPVAELRFHGNVENKKDKVSDQKRKHNKKRKAESGLSDEDSGLQTHRKERINSPGVLLQSEKFSGVYGCLGCLFCRSKDWQSRHPCQECWGFCPSPPMHNILWTHRDCRATHFFELFKGCGAVRGVQVC